ncbi:MAG: DUF2934 domain-containing protein [Nitrosomonadales bacterium]|nr:MAG: DUF2934 domain-containing protein [Nitrosomonadales bacterium]
MSSKLKMAGNSKSAAPSGVIVSRAVEDLKSASPMQAPSALNGADRQKMIATAAYYLAEKRGFNNGDSIQDWLEAEAELDNAL